MGGFRRENRYLFRLQIRRRTFRAPGGVRPCPKKAFRRALILEPRPPQPRRTRKTLEYLSRLDSYKVKWHSYSEEYISSLGIFADAIIALMSCLARQERLRISDRTKAGLQRAVSQGKTLGRPKRLNIDQQAIELRKQGYSYSRIASELNISKTHAYKLCR